MKIGGKAIKRAAILIVFFVAAYFLVAHLQESEAGELSIEAGPTFLSGEFAQGGFLMMSERFFDRWEYNLGYVSKQQGAFSDGVQAVPENIFLGGSRIVTWRTFELGIGMSAWQRTGRISSGHLNWNLHAGWQFNPRWTLKVRHFSNAGSSGWNVGQDQITLSFRVGKQ